MYHFFLTRLFILAISITIINQVRSCEINPEAVPDRMYTLNEQEQMFLPNIKNDHHRKFTKNFLRFLDAKKDQIKHWSVDRRRKFNTDCKCLSNHLKDGGDLQFYNIVTSLFSNIRHLDTDPRADLFDPAQIESMADYWIEGNWEEKIDQASNDLHLKKERARIGILFYLVAEQISHWQYPNEDDDWKHPSGFLL